MSGLTIDGQYVADRLAPAFDIGPRDVPEDYWEGHRRPVGVWRPHGAPYDPYANGVDAPAFHQAWFEWSLTVGQPNRPEPPITTDFLLTAAEIAARRNTT